MNIYLARHGQDQDNVEGLLNGQRDRPLTALGLRQAQQLADKIVEHNLTFDKIYSSPLQRALVTAKTVATTLAMPEPEVLPDLIERDFGVMIGKLIADIPKLCGDDIIRAEVITYFLHPEGAETFEQLMDRGGRVLQKISSLHSVGNILLVTHGDIGKMIYAKYYNLSWEEVLRLFHFGNSELILLSSDSPATQAHVFKFEQHNH
jgi:probable phosphoglycerate mutase